MSPSLPLPGGRGFRRLVSRQGALVALLAVAVLVLLRLSLLRSFNADEIEAIHSGWLVYEGGVPYVDFFQHHHPLLYYVLAGVIGVFGESLDSVIAARAMIFVVALGIVALTWRLAARLFDERVAHVAAVLLCTTVLFGSKVIEVRPDIPMVFSGLACVYFFVRHGESRKTRDLVASALAAGASFLFLQKAVFVIAGLVVVGLARVFLGRGTWREFGLYAAVALSTLLPFALLFASREGGLSTYLFLNWRLNMPSEGTFSPENTMLASFEANAVLWIFALLSWPALRNWRQRELVVLALSALALVFCAHRPWPQYYMMALPFLAILAGAGLLRTFEARPTQALVVLALACVPAMHRWAVFGFRTNEGQLERMEYVLAVTEPGTVVHDGQPSYNLFRPDLDWFWFSLKPNQCLDRYRRVRDYQYDPLERILERKPALITSMGVSDVEDPRIRRLYRPAEEFSDLWVRRDLLAPGEQVAALPRR